MPSSTPNTARTTRGWSRIWTIVLFIALLTGTAWGAKTYFLDGGQPKNILLLGVDQDKTRTDVVLLAHIDPKLGIVNLLSIPRDSWVNIPCEGLKTCQSPDKLAHAHAWGGARGPETTVATVQNLLGVHIEGYAKVDFEGFETVINAMGGVDILIDQNMDYEDPTPPGLYIHFKASDKPQHLSGEKALEYVRYRNDGRGDIGRTERTRKFLYAVLDSIKQNGKVSQLPEIWKAVAPYVTTNLDGGTVAALARLAPKLDRRNIQMEMVPGRDVILQNGPWVWEVDAAKTQALVDNLIKSPKPPTQ